MDTSEEEILNILNAHDGKDEFLKPTSKIYHLKNGSEHFLRDLVDVLNNVTLDSIDGFDSTTNPDYFKDTSIQEQALRKIKDLIGDIIKSIQEEKNTTYSTNYNDLPKIPNSSFNVETDVVPVWGPWGQLVEMYYDYITLRNYSGTVWYKSKTIANKFIPDNGEYDLEL